MRTKAKRGRGRAVVAPEHSKLDNVVVPKELISSEKENSEPPTKTRRVVTPETSSQDETLNSSSVPTRAPTRRNLRGNKSAQTANIVPESDHPKARKQLAFGRGRSDLSFQPNVRQVYKTVRQMTGSIGGNGAFGPIYGELTIGSMQKMVNLMKKHTNFSASSRFIDVGSGLGKPNLHVAQDPGVEFSYGIEMEHSRWLLSMTNLKAVLEKSRSQSRLPLTVTKPGERIEHRCMFQHGNIKSARTFDPFTHVYMFSIGFPPKLWIHLAAAFNRSRSPFLICFHSPKTIVHKYEFDVELVAQTPTSMHGSSEGHTGYIYKRLEENSQENEGMICDPLFEEAYRATRQGLIPLYETVSGIVSEMHGSRLTRSKQVALSVECEGEAESDSESDSENS